MITRAYVKLTQLLQNEDGLTAVEYAVLGAIVVAAIAAVGSQFQTNLENAFTALFAGAPANGG